uniref:Uncharacterized protein n=1 Tax=Dulem virus 62 TaxID=3145773 RepID=A0AAU8B6Y0_9VIRU
MIQLKRVYECVSVDEFTQDCTNWQVDEHSLPISKADADIITMKIMGFMVFVFIIKQIKKSIKI